MKLLLFGEGSTDVGHPTRGAGGIGVVSRLGAIGELVRRLASEKFGREVQEWEIDCDRLPRLHHARGLEDKTKRAIQEAAVRGCTSVAVVIDRDRTPGNDRLDRLRGGRDELASIGIALANQTAVGVAIEAVEAWLLADEHALNDALDPEPSASGFPEPESLDGPPGSPTHPKPLFVDIVKRARRKVDDAYQAVASIADLATVRTRCQKGFGNFAEDVQARCV